MRWYGWCSARVVRKVQVLSVFGVAGAAWFLSYAARRARRLELRGRVAIVTGGGRGLGLAISRELAARGCRLAICGRDAETIENAVSELRRRGADVFGMACDASEPDDVERFVTAVVRHYGGVDVLVNNAGQCFVAPAVELSAADVARAFQNIFWVHYYPTMAVLPHLRRQGFGRIANVTSFAGKVAIPHQASYTAAKYAATGWSETLSAELAQDGVLVSTIAPPPLRNGAPLHVRFKGEQEAEFRWFTRALTSKIVASSAERTARVVVDALVHGDSERSVSVLTWILTRAHGTFPRLTTRVLRATDRLLLPPAAPAGRENAGRSTPPLLGAEVVARSSDPAVKRLARRTTEHERKFTPRAG